MWGVQLKWATQWWYSNWLVDEWLSWAYYARVKSYILRTKRYQRVNMAVTLVLESVTVSVTVWQFQWQCQCQWQDLFSLKKSVCISVYLLSSKSFLSSKTIISIHVICSFVISIWHIKQHLINIQKFSFCKKIKLIFFPWQRHIDLVTSYKQNHVEEILAGALSRCT